MSETKKDTELGTFTLSFDFELGWGCTERGLWVNRERAGVYDEMRVVLPRFLAALDSMQFPATWAIVGAMVHDPEKRDFSHLPDRARSFVEHFNKMSTNSSNDGRDLMELLLKTQIQHRIACHSYSHVRFDFNDFHEKNIKSEIQLFEDAIDVYGISAESLVCPQNIVRFESEFAESGYRQVRTSPMHGDKPDSRMRRIIHLPPFSIKNNEGGITRESGSVLYNPGVKRQRMLPLLHFRTKKAIQLSIRKGKHVHIWLHPFNLVDTPGVLESLLSILSFVAECRDAGKIETKLF